MTVNRKKLVDLLVDKTGFEKAEVEDQLLLFMDQLKSELAEGKDFKVPGLGTFSIEDEEVVFTAEEKLATEVNYKYAGMKPLEMIGAYKETPDVASEIISAKETETGKEPVPGVEEYSEEMAPTYDAEDETEVFEQIAAEGETEKIEEVSSNEEKIIEEKPVEQEPVTAEKAPEPEEEQAEPAASKTKDKAVASSGLSKKISSKPGRDSSDVLGKILVAAVIVIALGLSGWMFYDLGYFGGSSNGSQGREPVSQSRVGQNLSTVPDQQGEAEDNKAAADSVINGKAEESNKTSEQDQSNSTSSVTGIAEASRQSVYGLRGGASPRVKDGYTIVVHSLRDESKVQKLNQELQQQGYRTVISRASIMDTTFWRLGLGQFKTIDDAKEASMKLPDPYKSNHFIKRIQ